MFFQCLQPPCSPTMLLPAKVLTVHLSLGVERRSREGWWPGLPAETSLAQLCCGKGLRDQSWPDLQAQLWVTILPEWRGAGRTPARMCYDPEGFEL